MSDITRPVTMRNSRNMTWPRRATDSVLKVKARDMMPNFKVTAEALFQLWEVAGHEGVLQLRAQKYTSNHLLSVKLVPAKHKTDFLVPVRTGQLSPKQADSVWRGLFAAVDDFEKCQALEPLDIYRPQLLVSREGKRLRIEISLTHPLASFAMHRLESFKLVSTPLSQDLLCSHSGRTKFRCGFVTLDSSRRALPLLSTDPTSIRYPLVGIWVANIPADYVSGPALTHPSVWAACVRYLHTSLIHEKVSPDPGSLSFLLVHFQGKAKYYEVTTHSGSAWKISRAETEAVAHEDYFTPVFFNFSQEADISSLSLNRSLSFFEKTSDAKTLCQSSFSSSSGRDCSQYSRTSSESFSSSHSSDHYESARTQRNLQSQFQSIKTASETQRVSAGTNTTITAKVLREANTNTTITSLEEATDDSAYSPLQYRVPDQSDMPRIIFEPDSDSSDEDADVELLQLKYLRV